MKIEPHAQYSLTLPEITKNRDCCEGTARIKEKGKTYLLQPGNLSPSSTDERLQYDSYIMGAEFHEYPAETLSTMLGKLEYEDAIIELPDSLDYLLENSDGDGLSLAGLMSSTASNILQAKYHILISELPDTSNLNSDLSIAEAEQIGARAYIKQYTRESLIDWQFDQYDKINQLTLMVFCEIQQLRNADMSVSEVKSYLVCGLDDTGYYQLKFTENDKGEAILGSDKIYPTVNGQALRWIPCEVVSDDEMQAGSLPRSGGYLSPICNLALARYRTSADYKEALRNGVPTLFTGGWVEGDDELFKKINGGRSNITTGSRRANNLPNNVTVDVKGVALDDSPFINYFESNAKMARALGAKFSDTEVLAATATEANINAGNNNATLIKLTASIESATKRMILYCGMFNGLFNQDQIEENIDLIEIECKKDFNAKGMTPDEARAVKDLHQAGLISTESAITKLHEGGYTTLSADEEMLLIESSAPVPDTIQPVQNTLQSTKPVGDQTQEV